MNYIPHFGAKNASKRRLFPTWSWWLKPGESRVYQCEVRSPFFTCKIWPISLHFLKTCG